MSRSFNSVNDLKPGDVFTWWWPNSKTEKRPTLCMLISKLREPESDVTYITYLEDLRLKRENVLDSAQFFKINA